MNIQYYGHVLCKIHALKIHFNTRNYSLMNKRNVATFCNANFQGQLQLVTYGLKTFSFVHAHHRFTQFYRLRIKKSLPFLFLPNVNLNPDFQKCITFVEVSKPRL